MHFKMESGGGTAVLDTKAPSATPRISSTLPFGKPIAYSSISGPTYVTGQVLVQQIAYAVSDKIFSFSPETFDLDTALTQWSEAGDKNIHGWATSVIPLQTRTGAGSYALGYVFSPDFDISKRRIPQSIIAPSLSLRNLRSSLEQLSLLYGVANPFVAHIAAINYQSSSGLVSDYESAMQLAEDLGLGLVASLSTYESQHMALFATLMAKLVPTLHIYDGVRMARESLRVVDALSPTWISEIYHKVTSAVSGVNRRLDSSGKIMKLLRLFNRELGTSYSLFEYHGHNTPDTVVVVFGTVESQLVKQVVSKLAKDGAKIGAIVVRVYRPFVDEEFLDALPESVRKIAVLGQVHDSTAVQDVAVQSSLFSDVLAAVNLSADWDAVPVVTDVKYIASGISTAQSVTDIVHRFLSDGDFEPKAAPADTQAQQYTFWDVDDAATLGSPSVLAELLSRESTSNVYVHETYDNIVQGGVARTDIRNSKKSIEAPYAVEQADLAVVSDEKVLKSFDVIKGIKNEGKIILRLPNFKDEEIEKRIPIGFRKAVSDKDIQVFILDSAYSPTFENDNNSSKLLLELAFLKIARPYIAADDIAKLILVHRNSPSLLACVDAVNLCLREVDIPDSWAAVPAETTIPQLPENLVSNSFVPYDKEEPENQLKMSDWQVAAKGLIFKEAYGTAPTLRPDLPVKTSTVQVTENRRLTPLDYDRNIFHIEFDLGDSGVTYNIGEALGIHAENDTEQVQEFIDFYGVDPDELVSVPSREDPEAVETRTVYQSLIQNIDILGKPPKRFYEALAEFATDELEKKKLEALGGKEGADEFKKRTEVDTATYFDILREFKSAHPSFTDLVQIVSPLKRREYSIASAQAVTPTSVALMIVVVDWVDSKGRTRYGHASRYLSLLRPGAKVTVSVKPSVMKLPTNDKAPLIMAGLGTGLAPFRAFVQYRAMQKAQGKEIGAILLYLGSRHKREEYLYGEEWEGYLDAGVVTLLGAAFSRDQPQKIYIQDRMRQTMRSIIQSYIKDEGTFYLCGPTWPVPDVTDVLMEAIAVNARRTGKKVDPKKEIERLKEDGRYVLEVY
jgi:sulfite reductase (NADPH) flavoprotein alpha-component